MLQINEFVKRARQAKIHAYIIGQLKKEMPAMIGKVKAQQRLIDNLEDEFGKVSVYFIRWAIFQTVSISFTCEALVKKQYYITLHCITSLFGPEPLNLNSVM